MCAIIHTLIPARKNGNGRRYSEDKNKGVKGDGADRQ